jgi:hypothetical protein
MKKENLEVRRFSLLIAISLILNVFSLHPAFSAGQKYELLDMSRSKCNTGKFAPDDFAKCLAGTENPSVKFEILSKQISPGALLKLRMYFNFNIEPLDGWFEANAHRNDAIWFIQKGPEVNDESRLGNLAKGYIQMYCPNTSFNKSFAFNIINFVEGRSAELTTIRRVLAQFEDDWGNFIPPITMFSNGSYDLQVTLPSSCKEFQLNLSSVSQGILMQDFKYIRPLDQSVASTGVWIARSREEGEKIAYGFKTSGKAPAVSKSTAKPSPSASVKCSAADLKKYKYTKEQYLNRNSLIKIANEIKNIIETKREKLSALYGRYVDYTQKDLYELQQQDRRIEKAERERAEWEPDLRILAKKCGFPMTSKTEVLPGS